MHLLLKAVNHLQPKKNVAEESVGVLLWGVPLHDDEPARVEHVEVVRLVSFLKKYFTLLQVPVVDMLHQLHEVVITHELLVLLEKLEFFQVLSQHSSLLAALFLLTHYLQEVFFLHFRFSHPLSAIKHLIGTLSLAIYNRTL